MGTARKRASTKKKSTPEKKSTAKKKSDGKVKVPTAKDYLRDLKKMRVTGEPAWGMLSEDIFATAVKERVPTGSLGLDQLIGGGWPVGRIIEVASWPNVGKSTLLDQSVAQVQRMGGVAALIDSEQSRDEGYTKCLGVNLDDLLVHPASTIEECFAGIDRVLDLQEKVKADLKRDPPIMFIVWDSIGGTPTQAEKVGKAGDKFIGSAARNIRQNLRRVCYRIANLRVVLICANHFYQSIGPFATLNTYGGKGVPYFSSLRVWLRMKEKLKVGDKAVGHIVEAKIKKTKIGKPRDPIDIGLIWGSGIDNSYTLFEWGKKHGAGADHQWVTRHGNWFYLIRPDGTDVGFQHGFAGLGKVLQEHPDIYKQMAEQFLAEGV